MTTFPSFSAGGDGPAAPGPARRPGPIEDDGLYGLAAPRAPSATWTPTNAQRVQASTLLSDPDHGLPLAFFDPFAPARERAAHVAQVLERAIQAGTLPGVPMQPAAYEQLWAETFGWGPAQPYLDDPATTEINIIERGLEVHQRGRDRVWMPEVMPSIGFTLTRIQVLASLSRVVLSEATPQADIPCGFGCRLSVTIPPIIQNGVSVVFRRGRPSYWTIDDLRERDMASPPLLDLLMALLAAGNAFLVAGSTGAGKTTVLEALINSLPGQPKILTIEDNALELRLRPELPWIRELVPVSGDPLAFGALIKASLRQSPRWIVPGESRGAEMGAVLSALQTGHSLATTIHAEWPEQALQQAATFAAAEGAYMFARQPELAMQVVGSAFALVIMVEEWPHLGRRLITSVSLIGGTRLDSTTGRLVPVTIPLAEARVQDGVIDWEVHATVEGGVLVWRDETTVTPPQVARRLARAATMVQLTTNYERAERDRVRDALHAGQQALGRGDTRRARALLKDGWLVRHDESLLPLAQAILHADGDLHAEIYAQWTLCWAQLEAALGLAQWADAQAALRAIESEPLLLVVQPPAGGWDAVRAQLAAGLTVQAQAAQVLRDGPGLMQTGQVQVVRQQLAQLDPERVPPALRLPIAELRAQMLQVLVDAAQVNPNALTAVQAEVARLREQQQKGDRP